MDELKRELVILTPVLSAPTRSDVLGWQGQAPAPGQDVDDVGAASLRPCLEAHLALGSKLGRRTIEANS